MCHVFLQSPEPYQEHVLIKQFVCVCCICFFFLLHFIVPVGVFSRCQFVIRVCFLPIDLFFLNTGKLLLPLFIMWLIHKVSINAQTLNKPNPTETQTTKHHNQIIYSVFLHIILISKNIYICTYGLTDVNKFHCKLK